LATGFNIPGCGSEYQGAPGGGSGGGSGTGGGGTGSGSQRYTVAILGHGGNIEEIQSIRQAVAGRRPLADVTFVAIDSSSSATRLVREEFPDIDAIEGRFSEVILGGVDEIYIIRPGSEAISQNQVSSFVQRELRPGGIFYGAVAQGDFQEMLFNQLRSTIPNLSMNGPIPEEVFITPQGNSLGVPFSSSQSISFEGIGPLVEIFSGLVNRVTGGGG
jgi:hypothetical protein